MKSFVFPSRVPLAHFIAGWYYLKKYFLKHTCIEQQKNFNILSLQVSWIRKRDLHILSTGTSTYTSDERFQVDLSFSWCCVRHNEMTKNFCVWQDSCPITLWNYIAQFFLSKFKNFHFCDIFWQLVESFMILTDCRTWTVRELDSPN